MKTDLKKPCDQCPFRSDIRPFIRASRARELVSDRAMDGVFPCHKTVDYSDGESDAGDYHLPGPGEQECAGRLLMMLHEEDLGQMARIYTRTGWNPETMDMTAPVYQSREEFIEAHEEAEENLRRARESGK